MRNTVMVEQSHVNQNGPRWKAVLSIEILIVEFQLCYSGRTLALISIEIIIEIDQAPGTFPLSRQDEKVKVRNFFMEKLLQLFQRSIITNFLIWDKDKQSQLHNFALNNSYLLPSC